jgi:hypothetical protein
MNCPNCQANLEKGEVRCGACNKVVATTTEDLQKTDPRSWLLVGLAFSIIGVLGIIFVYLNRDRPAFSNQDYYSGGVLALIGLGVIIYSRVKSK